MKLVVLGAGGGLGRNAVDAALAAGHEVRAMVRDPKRVALPAAVEVIAGDAARADDVARAMTGMHAALFCVNPPISDWLTAFPPLVASAIEGARRTGARLVFPANVWIYGRGKPGDLIAEDRAPAPISKRGAMRAEHEAQIRGAGIKYALLRLPEFYGPHVVTLTPRMIRAALEGKRARWPGPLDVAIELVYMPDAAVAMVAVAARGEDDVVHLPGVRTTPREFIAAAFAAVGAPLRASGTPAWLLSLAGVFDSTIRSVADIGHLWTHPILLDGTRYTSRYGAPPVTPLPAALATTIAWLRAAKDVRMQG